MSSQNHNPNFLSDQCLPQPQLSTLIQQLGDCRNPQMIESKEHEIVLKVVGGKDLVKGLKCVVEEMEGWSFRRVWGWVVGDGEFVAGRRKEVREVFWGYFGGVEGQMIDLEGQTNSTQDQMKINHLDPVKQQLLLQLLLNPIPSINSTMLTSLLAQKNLLSPPNFPLLAYFLTNITSTLSKLPDHSYINLNELSLLCLKILKSHATSQLPKQSVDVALGFLLENVLNDRKIQDQTENSREKSMQNEMKRLVLGIVGEMVQKEGYGKMGGVYGVIAMAVQQYVKFLQSGQTDHSQNAKTQPLITANKLSQLLITITQSHIPTLFPSLSQLGPQSLSLQISKLTQHYEPSSNRPQTQSQQQQNPSTKKATQFQNTLKLNFRVSLLRGLSSLVKNVLEFVLVAGNSDGFREVVRKLHQQKVIERFARLCVVLGGSRDEKMFGDFVVVYCKRQKLSQLFGIGFDGVTEDILVRQIVRNCPELRVRGESGSSQLSTPKQLSYCLQELLISNHAKKLFNQIHSAIQTQYDQQFNPPQFSSACNTLTYIYRISNSSQQLQHILSKQRSKSFIIQEIKMFLNLNESCLAKYRGLIVEKTVQFLEEVMEIVLEGNQYLQEVVERIVIERFGQGERAGSALERLIEYYERVAGREWSDGYCNRIQIGRASEWVKRLQGQNSYQKIQINGSQMAQEKDQNSNNGANSESLIPIRLSNFTTRQQRLLNRLYEKLQCPRLSLNDRTTLLLFIIRVYDLSPCHSHYNQLSKLFTTNFKVVMARHALGLKISEEENKVTGEIYKLRQPNEWTRVLVVSELEVGRMEKEMRKWPGFYEEELKYLKRQMNQ